MLRYITYSAQFRGVNMLRYGYSLKIKGGSIRRNVRDSSCSESLEHRFLLRHRWGQHAPEYPEYGLEYQKAQIYNLLEKVGIAFEKKAGLILKV